MATPGKLPFGSNNPSKRLISGAGGSIGAGHSTPGAAPLKNLAPQGAKKHADGKSTTDAHNPTADHNFNPTGGPRAGGANAKGGGSAVPRRTAPGG